MADKSRRAADFITLRQNFEKLPFDYDFFQALRLIENFYPDKPKIGYSNRISDDPVRFCQLPSLSFAPSTLASFKKGNEGFPSRLNVFFFGLFGPNGPLPLHITEYVYDRIRNVNDYSFARFADIFHHRMLSLFYRAWASGEPTVHFDRPKKDKFSIYVGSLVGSGMASLKKRSYVSDFVKLFYAGRFSFQGKNAEGLKAVLKGFFSVPVFIEQFIGQWLKLPKEACWQLGITDEKSSLGRSSTLGSRVWDCQFKFRILIGPIDYQTYLCFMPNKNNIQRLNAIVREYIGDELDWDVKLILKKEEVPPLKLGDIGELGWTSWLGQNKQKNFNHELLVS